MSLLALVGATAPSLAGPGRPAAESGSSVASTQESPEILPTQNATFAVFVQGRRLGTEQLNVERMPTELIVRGTGRLMPPIDLTLRSAELRYGLDLSPKRVVIDGWLRDHSVKLDVRFDGTTATNSYELNGEPQETKLAVSPGTVVLPETFFGAYAVLGARLARAKVGDELRVYIAPAGELSVVLNEVLNERIQVASRTFDVRRHRITFQNPGAPFDAEIETETDGKLVRLMLSNIQVQLSREDVASVAARQQRFTRAGDEDVRIPANGFSLAASVSRPTSIPLPPPGQKTTKLPAIVLVPDAGHLDRDLIVHGIPIFGQLASNLADAGYFVVRYDKRGLGQSGGREEAATLNDYADDVLGAVRWLRDRKDVDGKNITVVGYGEGAWVSLLAAAREKRIARVVLIGAAGTKGADLVLEQQQAALRKTSIAEAEKQKRVELQQRIHAALLGDGNWSGVPEELRRQADSLGFASLLAFDPAVVIPKVRQPMLIVAGERDMQVPAHHAQKLASAAKARKKDPGALVVTIPGVNHLLSPAQTGEPEEYPTLSVRQISPDVAKAIASWIAGK